MDSLFTTQQHKFVNNSSNQAEDRDSDLRSEFSTINMLNTDASQQIAPRGSSLRSRGVESRARRRRDSTSQRVRDKTHFFWYRKGG